MPDEYFFDSAEAALRRFPDELWVAKGKPKLWVKLYEAHGISVWRDLAYGLLRLQTKEGVAEGTSQVTLGKVSVVKTGQTVEVYAPKEELEVSPEEDTLELDLEEEVEMGKEQEGLDGPGPREEATKTELKERARREKS
jgi:hypothetical protein